MPGCSRARAGTARRRAAADELADGDDPLADRFCAAFSTVAAIAIGSLSSATTVAPGQSFAAAIDRMPEPQPTSATRAGRRPASARSCSSSSTSRVLACVPVPNAMPGSSSITTSSGGRFVALPARHDDELAGQPADLEVAFPRVAPLGLGHRRSRADASRIERGAAGGPARDRVASLRERRERRRRRRPRTPPRRRAARCPRVRRRRRMRSVPRRRRRQQLPPER